MTLDTSPSNPGATAGDMVSKIETDTKCLSHHKTVAG